MLDGEATPLLTLTQSAADKIAEVCAAEGLEGASLRVLVRSAGCSGLQYGVELDLEEPDTVMDLAFMDKGIRVLVDAYSARYLQGSTVDYMEEALTSGFKIDNPNAIKTCGCGSSFAAADGTTEGEAGDMQGGGCGSCGIR